MDKEQLNQMLQANGDSELIAVKQLKAKSQEPAADQAGAEQLRALLAQLYTARRQAGLTQAQLGKRAGLPQSAIARIETGRVDPTLGTLLKLVQGMGCRLTIC